VSPDTLHSSIEDAGLNASAPPQQRWLDGWLLRFSPGKAQRARCINAVSAGRLPLAERLDLCAALYRGWGLRMLVRITPFSCPAALDAKLDTRGFECFDHTSVMVAALPVERVPDALSPGLRLEPLSVEAYAHIIGKLRGTSVESMRAHEQRLTHSPVPYHAWVLRHDDGAVLAGGQLALEADLAGLYDVHTDISARGRGLARHLCLHLLAQAAQFGARQAYLQVDARNAPAIALYRQLGFAHAYSYHSRAPPALKEMWLCHFP
jgi:ribosomal protein S18 acetylase RimI-like enzyme